jgi:hypothetical protein
MCVLEVVYVCVRGHVQVLEINVSVICVVVYCQDGKLEIFRQKNITKIILSIIDGYSGICLIALGP